MNHLQSAARRALPLIDLTSLGENDTAADIEALCHRALTPIGHPAAVCVYPQFVELSCRVLEGLGLGGKVRVATVANFPTGRNSVADAAGEVRKAVALGAAEVDVVFPWAELVAGNEATGQALVAACREACGNRVLKVILETGELTRPELIRRAAELAIAGGADYVKTSTGKVAVNATPESARILLETIRESGGDVGCKVSGGIRTVEDAVVYLALADSIMGQDWARPETFRIGASSLMESVLQTLSIDSTRAHPARGGA